MNPEYLERMSAGELNEYGKALGIEMAHAKSVEDKIKLIETKRNNNAIISVLGLELSVPKKRVNDRRVVSLLASGFSDVEAEVAMRLLLGDEQMEEVVKACTDEDGTVDTIAMGVVFSEVITSPELKNL